MSLISEDCQENRFRDWNELGNKDKGNF